MKIIALEEHVVPRNVSEAWADTADRQDVSVTFNRHGYTAKLEDVGEGRLAAMTESGVDVQVLSLPAPGLQNFDPGEAVPLAADVNDMIAATVRRHPDRFEGFATLPASDPAAAARELERAVRTLHLKGALLNGRVRDRNMDDRTFDPIYEAAAALRVPLYLHPQIPSQPVRSAYYSGFGDEADIMFAMGAIGWHYELGIQLVRMVMAGVFDRHPDLQVIVGHWGEVVLFYLDRMELLDKAGLGLARPLKAYFRENVHYTPSGIFSHDYLAWTIRTVGVDRIMFSQDYPYQYAGAGGARKFLENAAIAEDDKVKIAHQNWEKLAG